MREVENVKDSERGWFDNGCCLIDCAFFSGFAQINDAGQARTTADRRSPDKYLNKYV